MSSNWSLPFFGLLEYLIANPKWLVIGIISAALIYLVSRVFGGRKEGKNPFAQSAVTPPQPIEIDQKKRDKVLRQGFAAHKLPNNLDAIIIGSGIGALSVATLLSRAGKKVVVLEQHDQAGGSCHSFIEEGFEFDVGIHYVGQMEDGKPGRILSDYLTNGQLVWEPLDNEFDVLLVGSEGKHEKIPMVAGGRDNFINNIVKYFPDEEKVIRKYFSITKKVNTYFMFYGMLKVQAKWLCQMLIKSGLIYLITDAFKWSNKTAQEVINQMTQNKKLRFVLSYCCGYEATPAHASFLMHALMPEHYADGGFYPRGGSSEIAFHSIPIIQQNGGRVFVRAPVSKILLSESGSVCGVRVKKGSGDIDVSAPIVISSAGYANTFYKLLPKEIAQKTAAYKYIEKLYTKDQVFFSAFIGLSASKEELFEQGFKSQNYFIYNSFDDISKVTDEYLTLPDDVAMETATIGCFVGFPTLKDSCWNEKYAGKSVVTLSSFVTWEMFSKWADERVKHRGDGYDELKNEIGKRLWEACVDAFPYLKDKAVYTSFGSAVSNEYYLGWHKGASLGMAHTPLRFSPEVAVEFRPTTDIPGLYMTGQDILTCGFLGAMMSGLMCSGAVLGRNTMGDFEAYQKLVRSEKKKQ